MASINWTDVAAIAPGVSTVDPSAQADILAFVNNELKVSEFGGESSAKLRMARLYLAAHHGTLVNRGDKAGPVVGESAGGLSRTYSAPSPAGTDPLLEQTAYGKQFRAIVRTSFARIPLII